MKTTTQGSLALADNPVANVALANIDLDPFNPRFGKRNGKPKSQIEILDSVVLEYGIEDVASSLAVNGFFPAEPVICIKKKTGRYVVVEGNRRVAACLVLAGDGRAKNHSKRTAEYQKLQAAHHRSAITEIPVISFDEGHSPKELISYLGVRHLAASLPWDSYAKAAWIAEVVKDGQLSMEDISMMTGDKNKTIARLLHGYYVIGQLVDTGNFNPEACIKKGRGSNADFAFSWYTPCWVTRP
jgi:ParB-like chromosome segregation protein Spo0J